MKKIEITKGKFTLVDDDNFEFLNQWSWHASFDKHTQSYYVLRKSKKENGKRMNIAMHRIIMNAKKGESVDHIDHNTLNNQRDNLRIVTVCENGKNRRLDKRNKSGCIGVSFNAKEKKWFASIHVNKKYKYIGSFVELKDAIKARNEANIKYGYHKNHGIKRTS